MNFLRRITQTFTHIFEKHLPDPFVLVLILSAFVMGSGMLFAQQSFVQMTIYWGDGLWGLLEFSMQMVLVLVTGILLARTPFVTRILQAIALRLHSPISAGIVITSISLLASWLNWGFGLVVGALLARELKSRMTTQQYALIIASAYSGFVVWHGGLSGSIPLAVATPGNFSEHLIGIIPTEQTLFSSFNIGIVVLIFIALPIFNGLLMKNLSNESLPLSTVDIDINKIPLNWCIRNLKDLEITPYLNKGMALLGFSYLLIYFLKPLGGLNLNIVILAFLSLALFLYSSPNQILTELSDAVSASSGIIIQFPFYAGIMGMLKGSHLAEMFSRGMIEYSTANTLPLTTFLSAGLLNLAVPSGGGQWALQSQVVIPAAQEMFVNVTRISMAVAWGDAWTNLIQPFWALPALALAGLKAKDIMGYGLLHLILTGVIIGFGLCFF